MPPKPNNLQLLPKQYSQKPLCSLLPPSLNPNSKLISLLKSNLQIPYNSKLIHFLTKNNSTLSSILLLSQSTPLSSLSLFTSLLNTSSIPTPQNFSILIHTLTFSKYYPHATHIISLFIKTHPTHNILCSLLHSRNTHFLNWSHVVFDLLITTYVKLGHVENAVNVLYGVVRMGFVPTTRTFNWVLNGLVKSGKNVDLCWNVYCEMKKIGVAPNDCTFNVMVNVICKGGEEKKVVEFLEEIEREGFEPGIVTYNTLIDGHCRRRWLDEAMLMYKVMYRRGVRPDLVTYTILIKGFCKEGRMNDAKILFDKMVERGMKPDGFCFGVLIYGYCVKGMMVEARAVFDDFVTFGLRPDEFTCNALVNGYVKVGKLLPCLNLIAEFRKNKIGVSFEAYRSVLSCLCLENRPNAAKSLLDWIVQDGYKPNLDMYTLVIDSFCKHDYVMEALDLKDEMIGRDIKPDLDTYQIIIGCLCGLGRVAEGESLMTEMTEYNLVPGSVVCASLVSGYLEKRDLIKAESILRYFAREFQNYDSISFNALLKIYCEEGEMVMSFELQNRMMKLGFVPNGEACKSMIRGLLRSRTNFAT